MMAFATAPPCAAESVEDYWQPCVEVKCSRARMRRLRDRRVAVRQAQKRTMVLRKVLNVTTSSSDLNANAVEFVPGIVTGLVKVAGGDWESDSALESVLDYLRPEIKVPVGLELSDKIGARRTLCEPQVAEGLPQSDLPELIIVNSSYFPPRAMLKQTQAAELLPTGDNALETSYVFAGPWEPLDNGVATQSENVSTTLMHDDVDKSEDILELPASQVRTDDHGEWEHMEKILRLGLKQVRGIFPQSYKKCLEEERQTPGNASVLKLSHQRRVRASEEFVEFCLAAIRDSLHSDRAQAAVERHFAKVEALVREDVEQMFLSAETSNVDAMRENHDQPDATKMKGATNRWTAPSSTSAVPLAPSATRRACMRVQWQCREKLVADDVLNYFSAYGQIEEFDWLEDCEKSQNSVEEIRLRFGKSGAGIAEAMRKHKHQIIRELDGKKIQVKVFVKFSDNVVT